MKRLLLPVACILCLCALLLRSPAHAQPAQVLEAGSEPAQQSMTLTVGDILEILPLHTVKDAKYAWILTQDRSFIEAQRTSVYRTRLTQPGNYTLFAEISGAEASSTIRRTFLLTVSAKETMPDGANPIPVSGGSGETLVTTDPKAGPEARIIVPQGHETLTLIPLDADRKPLALDLDTQTDSNGDGTANNDVDDANTYFQTNAIPLTLWFASPLVSFNMAVTAVGTDGNAVVQTFSVFSYEAAKSAGVMISPASIVIDQKSDSVFEFSVDFKDTVPGSTPLLYHWEFGDGEESLVAKPVHTYHGSGTYAVQLSIQNLLSGKEVAHYETQIQVTVGAGDGSDSSAPSSSPAVTPVETGSGGGIGIWTIILLLLVLIVSIGAGIGIMFLLSRLLKKRKPLHETIAEMEASMTKGDQVPPPAAPLVIEPKKAETVTPAAKKEATPPLAAVDVNAAPSWLKKGLNENSGTVTPAASPAPLPPPMPAPKAPAPFSPPPPPPMPAAPTIPTTPVQPVVEAPKIPTPTASKPALRSDSGQATSNTSSMPSWLQAPNATPAPKAPAAPAPVIPPSPAATAKPAPVVPAPAPVVSPPPAPISAPATPAAPAPSPVVPPQPKPEAPKVAASAPPPPPPAPKPATPPAPVVPPAPSIPAAITPPAAVKPAPVVPAIPAPIASKAPAPVAPAPVVTAPKVPAPTVPPAAAPKTAPAPVVAPPKAVTAPPAPKPLPAPIPDKELPPAPKPAATPSTPNQQPANQLTSNPPPDPTIAVIRAESIEDQNKKNGQGK